MQNDGKTLYTEERIDVTMRVLNSYELMKIGAKSAKEDIIHDQKRKSNRIT